MPRILNGTPDKISRDAADIAAYLVDFKKAPEAPRRKTRKSDVKAGKALYNELGCVACHRLPSEKRFRTGDSRRIYPDLNQKWHESALTAFLQAPERNHPEIAMPNFRLTENEASALTAYLHDATKTKARTSSWSKGDATRGKELLHSSKCMDCHNFNDGPLATKTAKFMTKIDAGCLADDANRRGNAPDFGFSSVELDALRTFDVDDQESLRRVARAEDAELQIQQFNCAACHAIEGERDFWSELVPPDEASGDEDSIHVGRPHLNSVGEKLNTDYLEKLLTGTLEYKTRPGLKERMPGFPNHGEKLARGLNAMHGFGPSERDTSEADEKLAAIGKNLATNDEMFRCNTCHGIGDALPLAGADTETINFKHIPERLRKPFFHRFLLDPQRTLPGTQMPEFADDDGASTISGILDGDVEKQFDAIWQHMRSLN